MLQDSENKFIVRSLASALGFEYCGIAKPEFLEDDARRLEKWLNENKQGTMAYMANHFDLRTDPRKLVPGAKSVITLLFNYYPETQQARDVPVISKYAYGADYHEIIRSKLNLFLDRLREQFGEIQGRGFVDSAPVLERTWAVKSGLGWVGKNGNLITKKQGSFFFIATLITDLQIEPDIPFNQDFCGTCTRCIDHCPTEAILPGKVVDGSKCISYFTIELKDGHIPHPLTGAWGDRIFGCDICQDVCPWNRFSIAHKNEELKPLDAVMNFSKKDWEELTEESFKIIFRHSPIKRTRWKGMMRNVAFIKRKHE